MSIERVKELGRLSVEEIFNKGNLDLIPEIVSPDYVNHAANGQDVKGIEGFRQMVVTMRTAMPDLHFTVDDTIIEGDKAANRCTLTGTYSGTIGDVEIKDKKIKMTQAIFARVENNQIIEGWSFSDSAVLFQQLGVTPPTS
jgi:predicted ester cyclase